MECTASSSVKLVYEKHNYVSQIIWGHSSSTTSHMPAQPYDYTWLGMSHETKLYFPHNSKGLGQCYITSEITLWIFSIIPYLKYELQ